MSTDESRPTNFAELFGGDEAGELSIWIFHREGTGLEFEGLVYLGEPPQWVVDLVGNALAIRAADQEREQMQGRARSN